MTMPRVGAKRKGINEANRQKILKRWRTDEPPTPPSAPAAGGSREPDFSTPHDNHVSSAIYRHSLLPEKEREAHQTSDDSVMVVISLLRLQTLLSLVV